VGIALSTTEKVGFQSSLFFIGLVLLMGWIVVDFWRLLENNSSESCHPELDSGSHVNRNKILNQVQDDNKRKYLLRRVTLLMLTVFLGFSLGAWKGDREITVLENQKSREIKNEKFYVSAFPEKSTKNQRLVLSNVSKRQEKILTYADPNLDFQYGEILEISCKAELVENFDEKFNYRKFLAKDNIYQTCRWLEFEETGEFAGNVVKRSVFSLREKIEQRIAQLYRGPEEGYLAGLLLGGDDRLPEEVLEDFKRTGTIHTVAVSGYNITIIAAFLMIVAIFIGFWRGQAFYLAISGITIFVIMIGAPSSAVRAAVMGGLVLWGAKEGRLVQSWRVIILAAAIMVFSSPFSLIYDAGFQLSFLATLGIVTIYSPLANKFGVKNDFLELKSIFLTTLAAQFGVLGILIYHFETFSVVSLLVNVIILPVVPAIMLGGFLSIIFSFIFMPLAELLSQLVWLVLHLEIEVIHYFAGFDWALLETGNPGLGWLVGYYLFLGLLVRKLNRKK
jgi:competence protein ComEC